MIGALLASCLDRNIAIRVGARVRRLVVENDAVVRVTVHSHDDDVAP
ncbi:hypothetical protein AS9A_0173 [Hoyosella subflava DQS3-9A1]|uniref:Uncharacterized protein n=1 Tax=Hoyosella subflava (strain DSM 45089 / JCM 17490 / NBRC 109087 / DQS3-9A1) TaxID=443218 RepID=F6EF54_HOYSD|nr:hypothetical protein AS9A_0173 [Hoyosella subflava DQS3-9A1]